MTVYDLSSFGSNVHRIFDKGLKRFFAITKAEELKALLLLRSYAL